MLIGLLIGLILGAGIIFIILHSKIQNINEDIKQQNQQLQNNNLTLQTENNKLQEENNKLQIDNNQLSVNNDTLKEKNNQLQIDYQVWATKKEALTSNIEELKKYTDEYYNKNLELAQENLDNSLTQIAKQYQNSEEDYKNEYLKTLSEYIDDFQQQIQSKTNEANELEVQLQNLRATVQAAVEAAKRKVEKENQIDFYRLQLTDEDISEIKKIREIIPFLRNKEPLNKIIYKCYYEKPYSDLIGRVVGSSIKTGIYKITNIDNQMCYIGQAVNIAERWKQHIKRGVGADTPTRNKLYPAMYAIGPEHFTFEVIEECPKAQLDEREDYWQDYFKAKEFGYSIK